MGRVRMAGILVAVLLAQPAWAQQRGLGVPMLPPAQPPLWEPRPPRPPEVVPTLEPPPNILGGDRPDLFRARPDTYQPEPDRLFFPVSYVWVPVFYPPFVQPSYVPQVRREAGVVHSLPVPPLAPPPAPAARPATAPSPSPAAPAPLARTPHSGPFYVIPGCYGGDRPPRPDQLRPGCRLADVRVLTSRPS